MTIKHQEFDRSRIRLEPLASRQNNLRLESITSLKKSLHVDPAFNAIAEKIRDAKEKNASVVLMMGAHVLRSGVQKYLIDMMEKGCISCIAFNGAGVIHDYEFALIGETTESVAKYIKEGYFGLWQETGRINDIITKASKKELGFGEAVGRVIEEEGFPHKDISLLAAGYRLDVPITVHVGIGHDIIHEFPNCDGASIGALSYRDFLRYTYILESIENGVMMNFGSAVMAPEIFLKALSMVRNVARQEGKNIAKFTTLVCDLVNLPENYHTEASKENPFYYFRPWKTMLVRTVADGGESYYVRGRHDKTIPQLWTALNL